MLETIPAENVKDYSVNWSEDNGINNKDHKDYLQLFCDDFYTKVTELIDSAAMVQKQSSNVSWPNFSRSHICNSSSTHASFRSH